MSLRSLQDSVEPLRGFDRCVAKLNAAFWSTESDMPCSVPQSRVIFALAEGEIAGISALRRRLGIDGGFLSRILKSLETSGLVARERSTVDARRQLVRLTEAGRAVRQTFEQRRTERICALLRPMSELDRRRLLVAIATIRDVLEGVPPPVDDPGS